MLIGAMNHPGRPVLDEIRWMGAMKLDFIDLTLEPPLAATWKIDPAKILTALQEQGLKVVGHTAYYLPLASPFESVRRAAVDEMKRCLDAFAKIGASWMTFQHSGIRSLEFT